MATSSELSNTLKSITITKIRELEKQRSSYNARKHAILTDVGESGESVSVEQLLKLYEGIKNLPDTPSPDVELYNASCLLGQARFDPSVSQDQLKVIDANLRARLDVGSRKLDLAHLYSRLLTEWIETPANADDEPADLERSGSEASFEVVEDTQKARLEQLRDKFARVVFEPLETDGNAIKDYLDNLFAGGHDIKMLEEMRRQVSDYGNIMLQESFQIDEQSLRWCIKSLLKNQLLNDEKKASLNDFLKDDAVLKEILDVLNMRFRDIRDWDWDLGEDGMPVLPRQSLNGKWRVMMDEDVLQAILTQWIGTTWAVQMKRVLQRTRYSQVLWKQYPQPLQEDVRKWGYFGEANRDLASVARERYDVYSQTFFMAPLPNKFFEEAGGYDDDDEVTGDDDKKSPKDVKQLLLRTLATEVLLRRTFESEVAVVQSDFQWFATGIAHTTVFAVLRFMGFSDIWITFFKKVLQPPLDMLDGGPVRTRKRGLPMAHIFEKLFGELVLYFLDLAVAQHDGMILYRFHDDLWLAGKPAQVAESWKTMERFAEVMGLEFNKHKTGSVYLVNDEKQRDAQITKTLPEGEVAMNFLRLDKTSGQWEINQDHVQEHVQQLQKQLNESKSVLSWIKTWNSCIGRFFSYTFGEPALCFGKAHIDAILTTHEQMQKSMFPGTTVTNHIKDMLSSHFQGIESPPDAFICMPETLGGLGLKNPFVPLLLLRNGMVSPRDPEVHLSAFLKTEREDYERTKKDFEALSEREKRKRYKEAFPPDEYDTSEPPLSWEEAQTFPSLEEYSADREMTSSRLCKVYKRLLSLPKQQGVSFTSSVRHDIEQLSYLPEGLDERNATDKEVLWTVQAFREELTRLFGGLEIVDRGLLPLGVLGALRKRRVTWQMVL